MLDPYTNTPTERRNRTLLLGGLVLLLLLSISLAVFFGIKASKSTSYLTSQAELSEKPTDNLGIDPNQKLTVNAQLQVNGGLSLGAITAPDNALPGTLIFESTTNTLQYYNGSSFVSLETSPPLPGSPGRVTSLQGRQGDINLIAGSGITISGTTISANIPTVPSVPDNLITDILGTNGLGISRSGTTVTASLPAAASPGLCLVSTAGTPIFTSCTSGGVSSVNSEFGALTIANATAASGTITIDNASTTTKGIAQFNSTNFTASLGTINTVQNIATTSSPTFNGLTLTSLTANGDTITDFTGTGLSVSGGSLQSSLGISVDSTEIIDGTILFADINNNSCGADEVIKRNVGNTAWICAADVTGSGTNTFATFDTSSGTDPVADSTTDTLQLLQGSGITVTGDATADSITIASILGTDIDLATAEVTGTLGVGNGGTGATSFTTNGILYGNAGGSLQVTAAGTTGQCLLATTGSAPTWGSCPGDGVGITTIGALDGGTANANAATITGNTIFLQSASATNPGLINTTTQTIAGGKTFSVGVTIDTTSSTALTVRNTGIGDVLVVYENANLIFDVFANGGLLSNNRASSNSTFNLQSTGDFLVQDNGTQAFLVSDAAVVQIGSGGTINFASANGDLYVQDAIEVDGSSVLGDASGDTLTVNATSTFSAPITLAASQSLTITGGTTASRPAAAEGKVYFDTDTDTLLVYSNGKWQADRSTATKVVAASNSSQAIKDSADFVADGTGDQTEINAALTAASGGKVYLAEGTYTVSASIAIPNNTTLEGVGDGTIITIPNAQNGTYSFITNTDTVTGAGVVVRNLKIDGNRANNGSGNYEGIYLNGVGGGTGATARSGALIEGVTVRSLYSSSGNGIWINNSPFSRVINNTVFDVRYYGIRVSSTNNVVVKGNVVEESDLLGVVFISVANSVIDSNAVKSSLLSGIYLTGSSGNSISSNSANSNGTGIQVEGSSSNNTFSGNGLYGNTGTGIQITDGSASNTIDSNTIYGGNTGIYTGNSFSNTFTSNTVRDSTAVALSMYVTTDNLVSNNSFFNSGGNTANNAIYLSSAHQNTFIGNKITDNSCTTTCYAIVTETVFDDSAPYGNYLEGNRYSGTFANAASIGDLAGGGFIYAGQQANTAQSDQSVSNFRFRGYVNSTTAFQVQNASGTDVLTVNTTAAGITVGGTVTYTAGTANTATAVCRNASGQLAGCTSAQRFKDDVANLNLGLDELRLLQPVSYTWNTTGEQDLGFIAEDVAAIIPQAVTYDENGEVSSFKYNTISALLVSSVQQLDLKVIALETRLAKVEQGAFDGNVSIAGNLKVTGTTELGMLTVGGKIASKGNTPQAFTAATGAIVSVRGTDVAGTVTLNTTQANPDSTLRIVFSTPYNGVDGEPVATISSVGQQSASLGVFIVSINTNELVLGFTNQPQPNQAYTFSYQVLQAKGSN